MVRHDIRVRGVDLTGTQQRNPVVVQMNDDDFPSRFLQDVLTQGATPVTQAPISSAAVVTPGSQPLFQPVQRMLNVALMELECESAMYPPVNPARVVSAGMVVRREVRRTGGSSGVYDDPDTLAGWMKNARGQWSWVTMLAGSPSLDPDLDPDPTLRRGLLSGQAATDLALAAMALGTAYTESTTPAFAAPPTTCAALGRTVVYGMVPTASSEVSDSTTWPPAITSAGLLSSLPGMLRSAAAPVIAPATPLSGLTLAQKTIDCRWLTDDFLNSVYPPSANSTNGAPQGNPAVAPFQVFLTSLRMLQAVFGAFGAQGAPILAILNRHLVTFDPSVTPHTQGMGDFYQSAYTTLMNYAGYGNPGATPPTLLMPDSWDWLNDQDQSDLVAAMMTALTQLAESRSSAAPQGRFQDDSRWYRLRMFARVKGETPNCPAELVWSHYSKPFQIAAWYATGNRAHPPVPLPDLTPQFMATVKPNCSFQVPGNLMNAMQGTTLSGLMGGSGGGSGPSLGWICGFNIPLITICAFFVLNIFLILLNIVFFWLPFIKICIPFPSVSEPD